MKETTEEFIRSLDVLFDMHVAYDQAISLIRHYSCQTKSMIAQDLRFLEDQSSSRKMELGKECCMKVIRKECRQREELQRGEREHCRLTKTQTINGAACFMSTLKTLDCKTLNLMLLDFRTSLDGGQLRHSTYT